jgi:hypothetical protein
MTKKQAAAIAKEINSFVVWDRMLNSFDFQTGDMKELRVIKMARNEAARRLNELLGREAVALCAVNN